MSRMFRMLYKRLSNQQALGALAGQRLAARARVCLQHLFLPRGHFSSVRLVLVLLILVKTSLNVPLRFTTVKFWLILYSKGSPCSSAVPLV